MAELGIKDLSISFGNTRALADVNLTIHAGELVFILGPSGCGKSTLLRAIAGFVEPERGSITLNGKEIGALPPHKRNTAMVFQSYALWPHLTVSENVAFGLKNRGLEPAIIKERVNSALELVRMQEYAKRSPQDLSGGQQQRVALARAVVCEPTVILLDEPLSNLDLGLRSSLRSEFYELQRKLKLTALYVTHDQTEALSIADRIVVMKAGKVIQVGAPREMYYKPATSYVASFLGEANLFSGEVRQAGSQKIVSTPLGDLPMSSSISATPGTLLQIAIRPERVLLTQPSADAVEIHGKLINTQFEGAFERLILQTADGARLTALYAGRVIPQSGDEFSVWVLPEDIIETLR